VSAEAIVIRLVVKTRAGSKDPVARELRARLKTTIDALGITLPPLNTIRLNHAEGGVPKQRAVPAAKRAADAAAKSGRSTK
jgi:small conductance mechanosensitive channel